MTTKNTKSGSIWRKILRVDLTKEKCVIENLSKQIYKKFLGGRGLGVKILFDGISPKIDPLSPENKLIFATGPLTGTHMPTGCRYEVITKSPLTGIITGANAGGYFGPILKRTGLDAIVIDGRAKSPVYLSIINNDYALLDAEKIWGWDTHKTTKWLTEKIGKKRASIACIGPAGENLVRFACIID